MRPDSSVSAKNSSVSAESDYPRETERQPSAVQTRPAGLVPEGGGVLRMGGGGVMGTLFDSLGELVQEGFLVGRTRTALGEHVDAEDQGFRLKKGCFCLFPPGLSLHLDRFLLVLGYFLRLSPRRRPGRLQNSSLPFIETHLFWLATLDPLCLLQSFLLPPSQLQFLLPFLHGLNDLPLILILRTFAILQVGDIRILIGIVSMIDHTFRLLRKEIALCKVVKLGLSLRMMGREGQGMGMRRL